MVPTSQYGSTCPIESTVITIVSYVEMWTSNFAILFPMSTYGSYYPVKRTGRQMFKLPDVSEHHHMST